MSYFANGCIRLLLPWEPCSQEWIRGIVGLGIVGSEAGYGSHVSRLLALRRCADRVVCPVSEGNAPALIRARVPGRSSGTSVPTALPGKVGIIRRLCHRRGTRSNSTDWGGFTWITGEVLAASRQSSQLEGGMRIMRDGAAGSRAAHRMWTEHVDEDVIVISGPEFEGLVVVPRPHVRGLEEFSISCRANILAAVQRATRSVREQNPWSAPRLSY